MRTALWADFVAQGAQDAVRIDTAIAAASTVDVPRHCHKFIRRCCVAVLMPLRVFRMHLLFLFDKRQDRSCWQGFNPKRYCGVTCLAIDATDMSDMTGFFQHPVLARALPVLRLAILIALIALIWRTVDIPLVLDLLAQADPVLLAAGLTAILGQNAVSAFRWRFTAVRLGQRIGRRQAVSEYFLSQFLNMTLPAGMLGDAGRALRMRGEVGLVLSGQAVLLERIVGQTALLMALCVGVALVALVGSGAGWPSWVINIGLGTAAVIAVTTLALSIAARLSGRMRRLTQGAFEALWLAVLAKEAWPRQISLSLLILCCNLGGFALCALATGTALSPLAIISILPMVLFTMVLPISIGGWGLREGAAAALWPVIGASAEAGVAASVAFGLVILVASLPGAVTLLRPSDQG